MHAMSWEQRYPPERLVPYDPAWVERYKAVAEVLGRALGPEWILEHVGSTSVPGLLAKPVIDVALQLPAGHELASWDPIFQGLGWTTPIKIGDHWAVFLLDGEARQVIGHIFAAEQWPSAHVRLFAQWLRAHDPDREEYARIKSGLVTSGVWGSDYTKAKSSFVLDIVNRARAARGLATVSIL